MYVECRNGTKHHYFYLKPTTSNRIKVNKNLFAILSKMLMKLSKTSTCHGRRSGCSFCLRAKMGSSQRRLSYHIKKELLALYFLFFSFCFYKYNNMTDFMT